MCLVAQFLWLQPRGSSLIAWLWKPPGLPPKSHGTVTIRETALGRLPRRGHCRESRPKHSPDHLRNRPILGVQELWPEGQASDLAQFK